MSVQTKSFIIIFTVAVVGSVFSIWLSRRELKKMPMNDSGYKVITYTNQENQKPQIYSVLPPVAPVDTKNWKTYKIAQYGISFSIDPNWKVAQSGTKYGYIVFNIDPGRRYDNFKLYVSSDSFFALNGVPSIPDTVAGQPAVNLESMVYGIKFNGTYYTFDMGYSLSLRPQFNALVKSLAFVE